MTAARYILLLILALVPVLASSQSGGAEYMDLVVGGVKYPVRVADFGTQVPTVIGSIGVLPLMAAEPAEACEPLVNPDELNSAIALVSRGGCTFVSKVQHASAAGAAAVVVYNHRADTPDPDTLILMGGDCTPQEGCTAPAVFASYASGQVIVDDFEGNAGAALLTTHPCDGYPAYQLDADGMDVPLWPLGFISDIPRYTICGPRFGLSDPEMYMASVLVGRRVEGEAMVSGTPFSNPSEYEEVDQLVPLTPPYPAPFESFDQAFRTAFSSSLGVLVTERAYAREDDPYVFFDFDVTNTTSGELDGMYFGLFVDWDLGASVQNLGSFEGGTNLVYAYVEEGSASRYSGVVAIGVEASGWTLTADGTSDESLYEGLTRTGGAVAETQDIRTVIGAGPFVLAPNETTNVRFAFVSGASEAEIIANAAEAQSAVVVASEPAAPSGAFALHTVYPNPLAARATIGLSLPTPQAVRVAVFDVLGREVAVFHDGPLAAGVHDLVLDASALPAGLYVVRATGAGHRATRKLVITR